MKPFWKGGLCLCIGAAASSCRDSSSSSSRAPVSDFIPLKTLCELPPYAVRLSQEEKFVLSHLFLRALAPTLKYLSSTT